MDSTSVIVISVTFTLMFVAFALGVWWVHRMEFNLQDTIDFHMDRINEITKDVYKLRGELAPYLTESKPPRRWTVGTQVDLGSLPPIQHKLTSDYPYYVFPSDLGDLDRENVIRKAAGIFCKQPERFLSLISEFHDAEGRQKVTLEKSLRTILRLWQDAKYHQAFSDMKELIEDYHGQNPHLDLPQLLWPDFAFDTGIYDPALDKSWKICRFLWTSKPVDHS